MFGWINDTKIKAAVNNHCRIFFYQDLTFITTINAKTIAVKLVVVISSSP